VSGIGFANLVDALSKHTRALLQDNWQTADGCTTVSVVSALRNPGSGTIAPNISSNIATTYTGGAIEFRSGESQGIAGCIRQITSVSLDGVISLDLPLPEAPPAGLHFSIFNTPDIQVTVTAPENLAEWDSEALSPPIADSPSAVASQTYGAPRFMARMTGFSESADGWLGVTVDETGTTVVTNSPIDVPAAAPGAVLASTALLTNAYTVPRNGSIVVAVTLTSTSASAVLQVSRNASASDPFYGAMNNNVGLTPGAEFDAQLPVAAGDVVQFQLASDATIGLMECYFVAQQ